MFSLSRTLEIILFALVNLGPYLILSYYIFRKHFRFAKPVVISVSCLLFLIQFATRYWSAMHGISTNVFMSILRLVIFIVAYAILFDQRLGKILFIELIFANLGNFILIAAICLERNLFPNIDHKLYCWHTSVVMLLLHLIITIPWILEARKYLLPMLDNHWIKKEWNYYWIVPMIFYIIWQYQINGNAKTGLENIENPQNVIFLFIINLGSVFIYYLMLKLDGQLAKNLILEERKHYQEVEAIAYQSLQGQIEETRRMRHDLRHHLHTVNYYLEAKEYDKLQEYLSAFDEQIPNGDNVHFCEHRMINNILFHYATKAQQEHIDYEVRVHISEDLPMNELDISVLLGNLLTNAIEACKFQEQDHRRIVINGKGDSVSLVFTIDNTFENEIKKDKNGEFLTTKKDGHGIGLLSAKKIVERYQGIFSADQKDNLFCVSFLIDF